MLVELYTGFNVYTGRSYAIEFINWLVGLRESKPKLPIICIFGVMHKEASYIRGDIQTWLRELGASEAVYRGNPSSLRDTTFNE